MKLDGPIGTGAITWANVKAESKTAYLKQTVSAPNNEPYFYSSTRIGYLAPSGDMSVGAPTLDTTAGHVFGRLGQGENTMPGKYAPFLWAASQASYRAGMLISFFPEAEADTGLNLETSTIEMVVQGADYLALNSITAPTQP